MVCLPVEMSCLFSLIAGYTCLSPFCVSGYAWHATALDSFAPHENSIYLTTGKLHPGLAKALASVASVALHYVMIDLDHIILACWYTGPIIHPYSYYFKIFSKIMSGLDRLTSPLDSQNLLGPDMDSWNMGSQTMISVLRTCVFTVNTIQPGVVMLRERVWGIKKCIA